MEAQGGRERVGEGKITSFDSSADLCHFTAFEKLQTTSGLTSGAQQINLFTKSVSSPYNVS